MRNPRRVLDTVAFVNATGRSRMMAKELTVAVDDYRSDAYPERRRKVGECKACHYLYRGRIGGAAMTHWECGICGDERMHGSTNTPCVCLPCSKEHNICTYCGGDVDMRERRRKWPTPTPKTEDK